MHYLALEQAKNTKALLSVMERGFIVDLDGSNCCAERPIRESNVGIECRVC